MAVAAEAIALLPAVQNGRASSLANNPFKFAAVSGNAKKTKSPKLRIERHAIVIPITDKSKLAYGKRARSLAKT